MIRSTRVTTVRGRTVLIIGQGKDALRVVLAPEEVVQLASEMIAAEEREMRKMQSKRPA